MQSQHSTSQHPEHTIKTWLWQHHAMGEALIQQEHLNQSEGAHVNTEAPRSIQGGLEIQM